jgi:hypothetical protein
MTGIVEIYLQMWRKNRFVSEEAFKVNISQCLYKLPVHVSRKRWGIFSFSDTVRASMQS